MCRRGDTYLTNEFEMDMAKTSSCAGKQPLSAPCQIWSMRCRPDLEEDEATDSHRKWGAWLRAYGVLAMNKHMRCGGRRVPPYLGTPTHAASRAAVCMNSTELAQGPCCGDGGAREAHVASSKG